MRRQSARQRARIAARRPATLEVLERDGHCRLRDMLVGHKCLGPLGPHHLHKQSAGGGDDPEGMVALCSAANSWVENNPDLAHALGLVIRRGDLR